MNKSGVITEIQRFCVDDGPGIRSVVFLKGCPLRCAWCHNPECIGGELHPGGRQATPAEVWSVLAQDKPYYTRSGGGITVSGGEPLQQPAFAAAVLQLAQQEGVHTAVETSGFGSVQALETLAPHADLFLYDYKVAPSQSLQWLGVEAGAIILSNLEQLASWGKPVLLRCPIVPGVNDTPAHLAAIAALVQRLGLLGAELLPYHSMGSDKAERLGLPSQRLFATPTEKQVADWHSQLDTLLHQKGNEKR